MAAIGLYINSTEQGFTVRGVNNNFFPDNATLAYPANSVILITDESDMATFRSASNYDVLFSALIKDININGEQVTKDNIIETFNEAANKPMSNPDAFTSVEYDGIKSLIFYNDKGDEVANVDVTPFIKDGMVEDVEISDGNLVIHFNTDSDIKDIYIPLTEIFDPEAYYTKQEIDNQVNDIWDTIDEKEEVIANALTEVKQDIDAKEEVISTSLNTLNENVENLSNDKQDKLQYYSENKYDEETGEEATAVIQVIGQGDSKGESSGINVRPYAVELGTSSEGEDTTLIIQSDGVNINDERVLTEPDLESAKAYYVDFAAMSVRGITDADWDGLVAAINAHRPILVKVGTANGYVNATAAGIFDNNITVTSADEGNASQYTFTKNGSNDYSVSTSTNQFVSQAEKDVWNAKQDAISDLETIRSGAALGATAYQKPSTGIPASDIADGVIPTVPTNVSAFTNDAGYLTQHQSLSDYYTKTETDNAIATAMEDIDLSDYVDVTTFNKKELATAKALTQLNDTKADKTELPDVSTLATKSEVEALEPYAIDLDAYVANGITEAQYDEIVQAVSDGRVIKATYETRDYIVESVYVDGDVMKISLSDELKHRFFQFGRSTGTVSPTTAEYVSLVEKGVWNTKQAALVSGTNIKTINGESLLGEGNIEIQGGGMDEDTELLISSALVDLNDRKIDATEVKENYQKKGDYATNTKVDTKANISDVPTNEDYEKAQKITSWSLNELNKRIVELEARVAQLEA